MNIKLSSLSKTHGEQTSNAMNYSAQGKENDERNILYPTNWHIWFHAYQQQTFFSDIAYFNSNPVEIIY